MSVRIFINISFVYISNVYISNELNQSQVKRLMGIQKYELCSSDKSLSLFDDRDMNLECAGPH